MYLASFNLVSLCSLCGRLVLYYKEQVELKKILPQIGSTVPLMLDPPERANGGSTSHWLNLIANLIWLVVVMESLGTFLVDIACLGDVFTLRFLY